MGRVCTSTEMLLLLMVVLSVKCVMSELASAVLPPVPPAVEANAKHAKIGEFVKLWKEALEIDGEDPGPAVRLNFEVRTVAAPDDFHMRNIVPQHVQNPLYIRNTSFSSLRKEFVLDHILIDAVELNAPSLTAPSGYRTASFSGKDITLRFDKKLGLVADGVQVTAAMTLQDGTRMLTLNGFLFGGRQRINSALDDILGKTRNADLDTPLGPPLDLSISLPQPPAPPSIDELARGSQGFVIQTPSRLVSLPALPPQRTVQPPAPPPGFPAEPSSSSIGASRNSQSTSTFGAQSGFSTQVHSSARFFPQPPAPPPTLSTQQQGSEASLASPALPSQQPTTPSITPSGKNLLSSSADLEQSLEQRLNSFNSQKVTTIGELSSELDTSQGHGQFQQINPEGVQSIGIPLPTGPDQFGSVNGSPNKLEIAQHINAFEVSASPEIPLTSVNRNTKSDHISHIKFNTQSQSTSEFGHGVHSSGHSDSQNSHFNDLKSSQISLNAGRQQVNQVGIPLPGLESSTGDVSNNDLKLSNVGSNLLAPVATDLTLETLDNRLDTIEDIMERENLDSTLEILRQTNFLEQLLDEESGTFLLLAPSNEALARLSDDELDDLKLSDLFSYHIIPLGDMPAPEVTNDSTFTTLLGKPVRFNVYDGKVFVNGQGLVRGDIRVPRGTIQVVDGVLRPPAGGLQTVLEQSKAQVARTAALLTMHGRTLSQDRPITVLAPLDASITSKGFSWPGLLESSAMAGSLLGGLTIEGSWYVEGLVRQRTLTSSVGMNITFRRMVDGTITANGIPLIMSDLSAVDGVAHVVADLIPNTDLGSDSSEPQTPILDLIKDGGIKNTPENFSGAQNFLTNSDPPSFKSVVDSGVQQRNNPNTGNFFANGINSGIPQLLGLYQTPVENNFDFNQPPPVFSPQQPSGAEDGDQNTPSYNIVAPVDSAPSFVPDFDSNNDEQNFDLSDSQETSFDTFLIDSTLNQEDGSDVSDSLDVGFLLPPIPATEVAGSDSTINEGDNSGVSTLDIGVSLPDTGADLSQVPLSGVGSILTDDAPTDGYGSGYTTPLSVGVAFPDPNSEGQNPVPASGLASSPGEEDDSDFNAFLDVGVPLPEANSAVEVPTSSSDYVDSTSNGGLDVGVDFSEADTDSPQISVNQFNGNSLPETNPRQTIADSIAQFDQFPNEDANIGVVQSAGGIGPEQDSSTTQTGVSVSSTSADVSSNDGSEFYTPDTDAFEPEVVPSISAAVPTSQNNIPTTNTDSASNVPNFLTLYNAPNLSSGERTDPFKSGIPTEFIRAQPSASSSTNEGLTSQSSARSFSSGSKVTGVNNIFISTPEALPGQNNPFDLSARTKSNDFKFKEQIPPLEILKAANDHDSFFVITRGNLNLKDVIDKLDENIRKHIHILDSPSIFFNSSVTELVLQKSLPEKLLEEIRLTLNANNMTFGNIGVTSSQDQSVGLNHQQISKQQAVPARDDSVRLALHNSESPLSVQSASAGTDSTFRLSNLINFGKTAIVTHENVSSNLSSNEIFTPVNAQKTHLSSAAQQTLHQTTSQSLHDDSTSFSNTTSHPPNFDSVTTTAQDFLELEGTTTEFFDVETTTLSQKTQKSLKPVSDLTNLLSFQESRKPLQDKKFPVVNVIEDDLTFTTSSLFDRTTEQFIELSTDPSISGDFDEFAVTDADGVPATSTGRPFSLAASTGNSEATISSSKATFAHQLQRDDVISSSHEQEINVIEFLRQKNLTAFADLLELTGLNRDMIRGGPWTIFAPSNEGIEIVRLSGGLDLSMKDLRHLTAYHVVPRVLTTDMFTEKSRLPTLYAGYTLYIESSDDDRWSAGGGLLTRNSWVHSGPSTWVTHEVDRVLYAPHGNLLTTMALAPALTNFTTLLAANPRIKRMLQGRRPMTVVAPSNAAMARLPPGIQPSQAWLESHMSRGFRYSVCFPRHATVDTLAGSEILTSTNATNGEIFNTTKTTNDIIFTTKTTNGVVSINGIPASYLDITAANGVLHVVDDLIVTGS
ncbi:FAS1 domain [Trinorchestia longiramus]|nr:FAS1 domain [Trinorchestia longiramus]